jgi:hypothetical protein
MSCRSQGHLSELKTRLECALETLSQADSVGTGAAPAGRQALIGNLAGAMLEYLTELDRLVGDAQINYVPSPQFTQLLALDPET